MDLQKSKLVVIIPIVVSILAAAFGSIKYIIKGFEFNYYLTAYNPEVYYKVMAYGNSKVKAYWRKYILLDTRWLPSAASEQRKNKIKTQLLEWSNAKKD